MINDIAMRAKLVLIKVEKFQTVEVLEFSAVTDKPFAADGSSEDNTYARYTPSATLKMTITNPNLLGKFKPGEKYYVDFTMAPVVVPAGLVGSLTNNSTGSNSNQGSQLK